MKNYKEKMNELLELMENAQVAPELRLKNFRDGDRTIEITWFDTNHNNRSITIYNFDTAEEVAEKYKAMKYILKRCKTFRGVVARINKIK